MRRALWVGLLACGLVQGACAGPGERPTTADMIFPIPWVFKQKSQAPVPPQAPAETRLEGGRQ